MKVTIELDDAAYAVLRESVESRMRPKAHALGAVMEAVYPGGVEEFLTLRIQNLVQIELQAHPAADLKVLEDQVQQRRKFYADTVRVHVGEDRTDPI